MALPSTTTTYHDDGNGHDDDDDDERRLPRATHTRGGGVCGRYGRTKGLFAPLGGLERLLHPTTLPILHRACASKAAHTTLLFRPAATLHLLEERPSTPPPRPLLPLLEGVHFDLSNPRPSSSSSHAEREKQLLSPSPSIQITPPFSSSPNLPPPSLTLLSIHFFLARLSLPPFRFLELLLLLICPRCAGTTSSRSFPPWKRRSSRGNLWPPRIVSSLHARKLEIARSLLPAERPVRDRRRVSVCLANMNREGRARGRGILNRW